MGLTEWVSGAAEKMSSTFEKAQDYAADAIVRMVEPPVQLEIDQRVTAFRDSALSELPQQTEDGLRSKAESGPTAVAWVFNRVRRSKSVAASIAMCCCPPLTNCCCPCLHYRTCSRPYLVWAGNMPTILSKQVHHSLSAASRLQMLMQAIASYILLFQHH